MERDQRADLETNWAAWLSFMTDQVPAGETHTVGSIRCCSVGVPIPLFNQAFVFEEPSVDDLQSAVGWLSQREVPFWVTAPESVANAIGEIAVTPGLVSEGTMPGMALAPLGDVPAGAVGAADRQLVTDPALLSDVAVVTAEAFGAPLEAAQMLAPASMLDDERCSWFVTHVDGEPAACGQLLRTDDVAGVYSIAVREQFRRRGLGAAISWTVLAAGRDAGCSVGVLQASPMGEPVYRRMGFETVTPYHLLVPSA